MIITTVFTENVNTILRASLHAIIQSKKPKKLDDAPYTVYVQIWRGNKQCTYFNHRCRTKEEAIEYDRRVHEFCGSCYTLIHKSFDLS